MKISMQCEDCREQVVWWLHGQRRLDATAARLTSVATVDGAIGGATICVSIKRVWSAGKSTVVSEYVELPACNLCHLPPEISYVDAAGTADAIATPVHVLRERAQLRAPDTVLVVGAGSDVGIHMVQMARV